MSKTSDNLKAAFAGESQANRKYLAFAKKADGEGYPQIAKLFRAVAAAETVHAHNHLQVLGGIQSTAENLQEAINGENYEVVSMYPPMITDAEGKGDSKAARTFKWAYEVEKVHELLYRKALELMGKKASTADYYVCPFCGYTHEGPLDGKCPVCGAAFEKFECVS
ncbi:MAG: rubrerythrin family protein [Chloroflexota bacterium]